MSDSIELVIKAANGSVDDFKMTAQHNWTVTQVKNHIYRHYPTHPPLSSQRLIHSGRMLLDQQTLLEALPDLNNIIQPVIIHLVAYERSASAPVLSQSSSTYNNSSNSSTTGAPPTRLRPQRSTASRQPSLTPVQEAADGGVAEGERGGAAPPVNDGRAPYPQQQGVPPQQQPWLRYRGTGQFQQQQANYAPAMGQFFMPMPGAFPPHLAGGFQPAAAGMMPAGAPPGFAGGAYPQAQFYQQYPFNQQMAQYWGYYNQFGREPGTAAAGGGGEVAMTSEGGEVVEDLDLQNLQELANNADVDEQDVPMNAGGLGMMAGGGAAQLRRHRDLVDYLYMLTMMGFLALIAYVTGSFGRLMVFAGGIIFMMLNQRGWFSLQRRRQARQRDERNPLERVAQQQRQEQEREGEGEGEGREEVDGGEQEASSQRNMEPDGGETQDNTQADDEQATQQLPHNEENEQGQAEEEGQEGVTMRGQEATPNPPPPLQQQQPQQLIEEPAAPRPGALRTILIFVTSFFTSLVPQQRPELQFN